MEVLNDSGYKIAAGVRADDRPDDHRVGARRLLDRAGRTALADHGRLRRLRGRPADREPADHPAPQLRRRVAGPRPGGRRHRHHGRSGHGRRARRRAAERSGMAASAANTSREIGAVAGTSILGALVFSQLSSTLDSHINALHVSAADKAAVMAFKPLIIKVIETGQIDKYLSRTQARAGSSPRSRAPPTGRSATACTRRSTCRPPRHPGRPPRRLHAG